MHALILCGDSIGRGSELPKKNRACRARRVVERVVMDDNLKGEWDWRRRRWLRLASVMMLVNVDDDDDAAIVLDKEASSPRRIERAERGG